MFEQLSIFDIYDTKKKPFKITNQIRLIELFGGIGSQHMSLRDLGADVVPWKLVEFDKYAIKSYNAIHGTNFETTDIRDVHGKDLEIVDTDKYTYIVCYSYPCFTKDTLVLTDDGFKTIENVTEDDKVLTHSNTYKKVLKSKCTGTKEIYQIKAMAFDSIRCTENHRFYARKCVRKYPRYADGSRGYIRSFDKPEWVECKDLDSSYYLGMAINQNSYIPKWGGITLCWSDGRKPRHKNQLNVLMDNEDFWWIVGRYLGDGWERTGGGIIICCKSGERNDITEKLDRCNLHYSISEERTVEKIHIPIKELGMFMSQFGKYAYGKKIPGFVFDLPCNLLKALTEGYVSADGSRKGNLTRVSSVSRELIYGFAQIVAKAYKTPIRVYKGERKKTCVIEGRLCNQRNAYSLNWKTEKKKQDHAFYEDGYIWFPIQSICNTHSYEEVFDLEVENDHSFTANGCIVHNCTDLSLAGLQKGMSKEDWLQGHSTRSGLLWEVERILLELSAEYRELPQVLLMENVPQVHAKKNLKDYESWLKTLEDLGYTNYWQDLNAKDYGIAQNRNRTFCVSILGNYDYKFPEPIELNTVMKDYLEEHPSEKLYLNSDRAKKLIDELVEGGKLPN